MEVLSEKVFDYLTHILKNLFIPIGIFTAGLIFLSIGMIQLFSAKNTVTTTLSTSPISPKSQASVNPNTITVDIEGAVQNPGVYHLSQNSRIQDALIASGGLSATADRNLIAKEINLAQKLTDSMKIYFPQAGDTTATAGNTAVLGTSTTDSSIPATGLININTASESDLESLPGVGKVTAQKIITNRPYASVDELLSKKVVSSKVFGEIKDKVTVQ